MAHGVNIKLNKIKIHFLLSAALEEACCELRTTVMYIGRNSGAISLFSLSVTIFPSYTSPSKNSGPIYIPPSTWLQAVSEK